MNTPAYTLNCSILLTDIPLLERPQAARSRLTTSVKLLRARYRLAAGDRGSAGPQSG